MPDRPSLPPATSSIAGERIAKVIARAGVCSRRDAERLIAEGRVSVNGRSIASPALNVTAADKVVVDGEQLPAVTAPRLWRYHKPRGRVTTHKDPEQRPTVFDALPEDLPRVVSIGRLDFNTEGLLLLTNSGALARHLELPATGWLRRYRVRAHGNVNEAALSALASGVEIDGVRYAGIEASLDRQQGANVWLTIGLREGKNREVRRILMTLGLDVNRLIRVSYGPFQLGELAAGGVEEVPIRTLREQLGKAAVDELGLSPTRQRGGAVPAAKAAGEAVPSPARKLANTACQARRCPARTANSSRCWRPTAWSRRAGSTDTGGRPAQAGRPLTLQPRDKRR